MDPFLASPAEELVTIKTTCCGRVSASAIATFGSTIFECLNTMRLLLLLFQM
jgi:hypothetical protein